MTIEDILEQELSSSLGIDVLSGSGFNLFAEVVDGNNNKPIIRATRGRGPTTSILTV